MRMSILGKTLIFAGIVLFGGMVVAEMVGLSLSSRSTMMEETVEPAPRSAVLPQPAGESASQPSRTTAAIPALEPVLPEQRSKSTSQPPRTVITAVQAARVINGVERIKRTFKLLHRSKETSPSSDEAKPGS